MTVPLFRHMSVHFNPSLELCACYVAAVMSDSLQPSEL